MENRGLLFIPDISGFTRFVNETEIDHSRRIIQELLEILINANQIGLEVSEVEGDAILFYKFGEPPQLDELYKQVEKMFREFHQNLSAYELRRYCQCKACTSAINLTLKVITHYGEFTGYNVKNFSKLIGKDIIVAHQLLKNDIEQHEYWLVTKSLLNNGSPAELTQWMKWNSSTKQMEHGIIPFHYTQLSQIKNEIIPDTYARPELSRKEKMISVSQEYEAGIIPLFHACGDFNYRHRWLEGVKKVEELDHYLPRVGMRCRCILENGEMVTYASSYFYQDDRIEFSETDEKNKSLTYFTLEKINDNRTKLTLDFYLEKSIFNSIVFKWKRKNKLETLFKKSLENLNEVVKEIKLPAEAL